MDEKRDSIESNISIDSSITTSTSELPRLVKKLASFRRQLLKEKNAKKLLINENNKIMNRLHDIENMLREKDKHLETILSENAKLKTKYHMTTLEPTTNCIIKDSEIDEQVNEKSKKDLQNSLRKIIKEHSTLQFHHTKLSERCHSDKLHAEQDRLALNSEINKLKESLKNVYEELKIEKEKNIQLQEKINTKKHDHKSKSYQKLKRQLKQKDHEIHELKEQINESRSLAQLYAHRAFKYKTKVETLELDIRKFPLLKSRPLLPGIPVEVLVKKMSSTGDVTLVIKVLDAPEDEYRQDIQTIYDIHPCTIENNLLPYPSKNDIDDVDYLLAPYSDDDDDSNNNNNDIWRKTSADMNMDMSTFGEEVSRNSQLNKLVIEDIQDSTLQITPTHQNATGMQRKQRFNTPPGGVVSWSTPLPKSGNHFCILFRRAPLHRCGQAGLDEHSMTFEANSTIDRNNCVDSLRQLILACRGSDIKDLYTNKPTPTKRMIRPLIKPL